MDAITRRIASPVGGTRTQRWFVAGLMLLFVGLSVQYSVKVTKGTHSGQPRSAINRWASQIQEMEAGEDIHKRHNYPNPPIMAILLLPFSELAAVSPLAAALAWFYIKVGLALLSMFWVFRMVETAERPFPAWAKALAVVLSIRPIMGDLSHGNINIFILFLVVASLYAFTHGRDFLAGVLLALAIACKVTPAMFLGYFLWKRGWRVLAGTAVGLTCFFLLIPGGLLGWQQNLRGLNSWIEVMILPYLVGGVVTPDHNNQSLPGLVARLLTNAPSFTVYLNDMYVPIRFNNIADIGTSAAKWLVTGCMGIFAVVVVWKCRTPIRVEGQSALETRRGWRLSAEYSMILLGMLLFSERTWKHHCVTLVLPFAVLCYGVAMLEISRFRRSVLIGTQVLAIGLITATSTGVLEGDSPRLQSVCETTSVAVGPLALLTGTMSGALTNSVGKMAQVYGAYVWAFFALLVGLTAMMRPLAVAAPALKPWWFLTGRRKADAPASVPQTTTLG